MAIGVLIVDDEPLARDKIRSFLEGEDDLEILGECRDGREALETIEAKRPDVVFLDVQMPELDGFEVLEHLEPESWPIVVFVTAYDQYALKAFEVHAIDYLLKPFDRSRFAEALGRAREEVGLQQAGQMRSQLEQLMSGLQRERSPYSERLVVKSSGRVLLLRVADIDWIDAAGNYVRLHAGSESWMMRETMARLEKSLDPEQFLRIHRSTIVNVERIKELEQQFHGDYVVVLETGQRLTLSRSYRSKMQELLGRTF